MLLPCKKCNGFVRCNQSIGMEPTREAVLNVIRSCKELKTYMAVTKDDSGCLVVKDHDILSKAVPPFKDLFAIPRGILEMELFVMKTKFKIQKIGRVMKKCDVEFFKISQKCHHHLPDVNIPSIADKALYRGCNKQSGPQPYCSPKTCPIIKKVKEAK